jgi:hypothetical protein
MMIFEAAEDDDGEYKMEAVNNYGEATMSCTVTVNGQWKQNILYGV